MTLSNLQVKSYLSASITGNIKYDLQGYFFIRLLAGCWSLAGALDAISLDITEFRVVNYYCCELIRHASLFSCSPALPISWGLKPHECATFDYTRRPLIRDGGGIAEPISRGSLPHWCPVAPPPVHCVHVAKLTIMHCKDTLRRGGVHIIHAQVCVCVHLCVYVCVCLCMVIYCIYYDRSDYMIVLCTHVYTNIILPITTSKPAEDES